MRMPQSVACRPSNMLAFVGLACGALVATTAWATGPFPGHYRVGQIIEPKKNTTLSDLEFRAILQSADIIYIGEAHYTPSHVAAALQVLQSVLGGSRKPILGMEMFSWDGQAGLERYLKGTVTSTEDFLAESHWKNNWGGKYADYSALVLGFCENRTRPWLNLAGPQSASSSCQERGENRTAGGHWE